MAKEKKKDESKLLYSVEGKIAEGSYATIYSAKHETSGHRVALKVIPEGVPDSHAENEIRLLQQGKHPNVIGFIAGWRARHWFIALELARCDVTALYAKQEIPERMLARIFLDTVSAISFLHSISILHRDVKGANLLLMPDGAIQLTDFGVSIKMQGEGETSLMGSPYWMAPEVILVSAQFKPYSFPADIWSLGITILECADGSIPRGNVLRESVVLSEIARQPPPRFIKYKPSDELNALVISCLSKDPAVRPTSAQLITLPWFNTAATKEELTAFASSCLLPVVLPSTNSDLDATARKKLSSKFENWFIRKEEKEKGKGRDRSDNNSRSSNAGPRDSPHRVRPAATPLNNAQFGKDEHGNLYLKRTTLDQAVDFIIAEPQELNFLSTFFITHRSFTSSEKLLLMFKQRFEAEAGKEGMQNRIRICILLKTWISKYQEDFDDALLLAVADMVRTVILPVIASSANVVLQIIEKRVREDLL